MADKKVKISDILDNLIPEFVRTENPLFTEFLKSYYVSEEREYGSTYLVDHITSFKNISSFADLIIGAINPATGQPFVPITLSEEILDFDETINVNTTVGFPSSYGLLRIENEIITYTGKTATSFTGCVRGFSGVSSIESAGNQEYLTFSKTESDDHPINTAVENLSFLYLQEFYRKHKSQFLPGFEERLFQNVSIENILTRAKDFFSSKGTDTSLKILFFVLYGKPVEIIKPFDYTISPSVADWEKTQDVVMERISGDPKKLLGTIIQQGSTIDSTASGAVSIVDEVFLGNKKYFKIGFSDGSIVNKFNISKKTRVIGSTTSTTIVSVDSTIGFPNSGSFYYFDGIQYVKITYARKNHNQFLDCTGLNSALSEGTEVSDAQFVFGYEGGEITKPVQMRIVGSVSGLASNKNVTSNFDSGDTITLKSFGEKYLDSDISFNRWFYNNISYINVSSVIPLSNSITTEVKNYINLGDRVDILLRSNLNVVVEDVEVSQIFTDTRFQIASGTLQTGVQYVVKRRVNFTVPTLGLDSTIANIQNSFTDDESNCYVTFSGFPSYSSIETTNRSFDVPSGAITTDGSGIINITSHGFINGEKVYYEPISGTRDTSEVFGGSYVVSVVNDNQIKLSLTPINLSIGGFVAFTSVGAGTHKITPNKLHNRTLKPQNNFKRIFSSPKPATNNKELLGSVGVALNGVEFESPIGDDSYFYGQIDKVEVLDGGSNFDINNPPEVLISDGTGVGVTAFGVFSGEVTDIIVSQAGFDFVGTPVVTLSGGNSTGSSLEAKMRGLTHSISVTDFDLDLSTSRISSNEHKFIDGEEVVYLASGTPIGIGSTNVGFSTDRLSSGSSYYIAKINNNVFSLASTKEDAIAKTKLVDFLGFGNEDHTFRSKKIRRVIDRISIVDPGTKFSDRKVIIDSVDYPVENIKDQFKYFVGINTHDDYIYARSHGFGNGDTVVYENNGTVISGISTNSYYKVTVVDEDKFKLSEAGTATSITSVNYDREIYTKLNTKGVGIHTFRYPDIAVNIDGVVALGQTTTIPSYFNAKATPVVKGGIESIFIKNGGHSFGSSDIVNYVKTPETKLLTGQDAELRPIINTAGELSSVYVLNTGSDYTTPPEVVINGSGSFAEIKVNIQDGKITSVDVVNGGKDYKASDTTITVIPTGSGSKFSAKVHEWKVNNVKRYESTLARVKDRDIVQFPSEISANGNKFVSFYPGRFYRNILNDNLTNSGGVLDEKTSGLSHSPIVGWAYDGNPIYGPYGNKNAIPQSNQTGGVVRLQSSYELDPITDSTLRPNLTNGYLYQDYVYENGLGDLDEFNGRYIVNEDFPEGTYAYFSSIDDTTKVPTFPYITLKHRNATDEFNYNLLIDQSDTYLDSGDYKRMVTHYGINDISRDYPFLSQFAKSEPEITVSSVKGSSVDQIKVLTSGINYKSKEKIKFSNNQIDAEIDKVFGKNVTSVVTTENENLNMSLRINDGKITAFCTAPHNYQNGDVIEISGISTVGYKHIEGNYKIGVSSITTALSTAIGTTAATGIVTSLTLLESPIKGTFNIDDVLRIGNEEVQIIGIDLVNNNYKVSRVFNSSTGSSHANGTAVYRLEDTFTFDSTSKVDDINIEHGLVEHFDPEQSVGIGTNYSSIVVGTAGSTNVIKSVPPRAIYISDHKFNTGDKLSYVSFGGTIVASRNFSLTPTFDLHDFSELFCVDLGTDYIGVSTERAGFSTSYVYFKETSGNHHKFEKVTDRVNANATRYNATVTVDENHELFANDVIDLSITSSETQTVELAFNEELRKLTINPVTFSGSAVTTGTTGSKITIPNHNFKTGDVVVYTFTNDEIEPLVKNGVYYVIKDSNDQIRLSATEYGYKVFPAEYIVFTTTGTTNQTLSKINSKITAYSGSTLSLDTSGLTNFDIDFYLDKDFQSQFDSPLIVKTASAINISVTSSLPKELYYKIQGLDTNYIKTYTDPIDTDVENYSLIEVIDSKYNGKHTIRTVTDKTLELNLPAIAETNSYTTSGIGTVFYSTSSERAKGGIYSVKIFNRGKNLIETPIVTSVATTTGSGASFNVSSNEIGEIVDTKVLTPGIEIPQDKTLTPRADAHVLLTLKDVFRLDSVGITSGGVNYNSTPRPILVGYPEVIMSAKVQGNAVSNVSVISGGSGLSNLAKVIPTLNSNGVEIVNATSTGTDNTLRIKAPITGFTTTSPFPFEIGDKIFIENIVISTGSGDGYNSSDYNYENLVVTGINTNQGAESVTYSIAGLGVTGGSFDSGASFGIVTKSENLATFEPVFEKIDFKIGEVVTNISKSASGTVQEWNPLTNNLKLRNVTGNFKENETIIGRINNFKADILGIQTYKFDLEVSSTTDNIRSWKDDTGKLNLDSQRIHDNDYYQRFSYSIKGTVPYETWNEPVNSLAHVSGYKNFSDYEVSNEVPARVGMTTIISALGLNVLVSDEASVHERYYYDFASESTVNPNLSKIIKFDSKIITDFNESRTNKVLLIDDISNQFTGFTTTTGGDIVGLSTFQLRNDGNTLLHHIFNPTSDINSSSTITIPGHNFNTAEPLLYTPSTGRLGIDTTGSPGIGIGNTDLLPNSVFAIKVDNDNIQLAIGSSEATAGTAVTFTTTTGVGLTHTLDVNEDLALTRAIITIDNVIQSPIARKVISVSLAQEVGIGTTSVFMDDVSNIQGKSLIKIDNEIIKVSSVGIGSTNSVNVVRGVLGTVAAAHTVGAGLTVLSGDYRIANGNVYFKEAPYGLTGIGTLGTRSSFAGRVFYKLDYGTNKVIDDISEQFNGTQDKFDLFTNGQVLTGINTNFGAILINNIFQKPFYGDVGSIQESDYQIVGTGQTIDFTGTTSRDLPRGGVINEFAIGVGTGYQPPRAGTGSAVVNGSGVITSVGIGSVGSGYIEAPRVSIADTLGVGIGASVIATIANGKITGFTVASGGTGYSQSSLPIVTVDPPAPYKNLPLVGGTGSGAKMDVVVGTGGSVISFNMSDRGLGYSVNDALTLSGLPHQSGITTASLEIVVNNKYQSKFAGWTFGQLLELDDFSEEFTGFRREFFLTRTTTSKEFYSVVAQEGAGIQLANNMLIFINDVLQKPNIDYTFTGGTKITFTEAPVPGSKFKIFFYTGSTDDFRFEDVDESIKVGDELRLQYWNGTAGQSNRTIYELVSADSVETEIYGGVGISTNTGFRRPVLWRKQTSDTVVDGLPVSKERDYLEPAIFPNTNIIASVASTDSKIYVKDSWAFGKIDDLGQTLNDVLIVGLGTTAVTEKLSGVTYEGDYGVITSIGASTSGINTTSPMLEIEVIPNAAIYDQSPDNNQISRSGIAAGDYFVLEKTFIGDGVESIIDDANTVVSVGNSFIDNVFYASKVVSVGSSGVRISANVKSLTGINTTGIPTTTGNLGCFTWGSITGSRNAGVAKSFEYFNQNGLLGIETSAYIRRTNQFRLAY